MFCWGNHATLKFTVMFLDNIVSVAALINVVQVLLNSIKKSSHVTKIVSKLFLHKLEMCVKVVTSQNFKYGDQSKTQKEVLNQKKGKLQIS